MPTKHTPIYIHVTVAQWSDNSCTGSTGMLLWMHTNLCNNLSGKYQLRKQVHVHVFHSSLKIFLSLFIMYMYMYMYMYVYIHMHM